MGWETRTLGEICDEVGGIIRTGPFGSQLHQSDYQDEGLPVVMPKDIVDGRVSVEGIARIGDEDVERLSQHRLKKGDIVYGRRGDIGRRAVITQREAGWLCGTGCLRISLGDSVLDPTFLYYYLGEAKVIGWIYNQAIGATMPNLNTSIIRSIPITYPSLPVQHKIAAILSAYDDLIENNTRRIEILEEMARSLYCEWFVNFRFPGHEQVKMVDSELGLIPEGWEIVSFTDIADILSGGTPKTKIPEYWGGDIPFFTPKDASSSFYVTETDKSITELGLKKCTSKLYPQNTVFITARGTVGKAVLTAVDMAMNQSCFALKGREDINQYFIFLIVNAYAAHLKQTASGATFDAIIIDNFRRLMVVKPPLNLIGKFGTLIEPFFEKILNLLNKNANLRQTRDLLLPKFISGEIDIENLDMHTGKIAA
jgi:type I restriction enzyme S subunit